MAQRPNSRRIGWRMFAILNVTAPFFALVLCGYLAARYRALPENAVPALNIFVLYFALPCMLFPFASGTPFGDIVNAPVFLAYMTAGLATFGVRNPLIWAVIVGGTFSGLEWRLPAPADQFVLLLGQAAGPVALFTIGASLYRPSTRVWGGGVGSIAGAKLVLHPCLAGVVANFGFGLTTLEVHTLVLAAALPVGGSVFLFAERQGANAERIAAAILVSTALAFVSFSTLCWALGIRLPG